MFTSHIKVLGGPHVAHGPDVAKTWSKLSFISVFLNRWDVFWVDRQIFLVLYKTIISYIVPKKYRLKITPKSTI